MSVVSSEEQAQRRDALASVKFERTTNTDNAARAIQLAILRGDLVPGTPLRESQLVSSLGVSRNVVREALRSLAGDGLVTYVAYRGCVVTELSEEDVRDIFVVRRLLEVEAATRVVENRAVHLPRLKAVLSPVETSLSTDDLALYIDADIRFHSALVASLGSERLDAFYLGQLRHLRLGLIRSKRPPQDLLVRNHANLVMAMESGEVSESVGLVLEHLEAAQLMLIENARAGLV